MDLPISRTQDIGEQESNSKCERAECGSGLRPRFYRIGRGCSRYLRKALSLSFPRLAKRLACCLEKAQTCCTHGCFCGNLERGGHTTLHQYGRTIFHQAFYDGLKGWVVTALSEYILYHDPRCPTTYLSYASEASSFGRAYAMQGDHQTRPSRFQYRRCWSSRHLPRHASRRNCGAYLSDLDSISMVSETAAEGTQALSFGSGNFSLLPPSALERADPNARIPKHVSVRIRVGGALRNVPSWIGLGPLPPTPGPPLPQKRACDGGVVAGVIHPSSLLNLGASRGGGTKKPPRNGITWMVLR